MTEITNPHKDVYRVLMVDDDELFLRAHRRLLHLVRVARINAIFEVVDVDNMAKALQTLDGAPFDCVLLDYSMPDGDGLTCLRRIVSTHPDLPVIIFTGAGNEHVAVEALKEGAVDYLIKGNLPLETLERAIVDAVAKRSLLKQIELQRKELVESERQRVMVHTLAAACHHLAQPLTVLRICVLMLKRDPSIVGETQDTVVKAFVAIEEASQLLDKMSHLTQYSTEPYLVSGGPGYDNEILRM